jgi:hypothetical protein
MRRGSVFPRMITAGFFAGVAFLSPSLGQGHRVHHEDPGVLIAMPWFMTTATVLASAISAPSCCGLPIRSGTSRTSGVPEPVSDTILEPFRKCRR